MKKLSFIIFTWVSILLASFPAFSATIYDTMTASVDFVTVATVLGTVFVTIVVVTVFRKGASFILKAIRGA